MHAIRCLIAQRHTAVFLCAVSLILKLLVPTGYMIGTDRGRVAMTICTGMAPKTVMMEMPGMKGEMPGHDKSKDHGKAEQPCAFAGLSTAMTGAVDPIQLAALIAFIMAIGVVGVLLAAPTEPSYLRPPLRGPPVTL